jgi:hypothetical protein
MNIKQFLKEHWTFFLLILTYFIISFFKILHFPVYIDEATTYVDYVSKGFFYSLSNYDEPNNHIFYSLILTFFCKLPVDILIAIRIPNVLIGVLVLIILYRFLNDKVSKPSAIISLTFLTFSYSFFFYSIFARGYMLIILCFLISLIIYEKWNLSNEKKYPFILGLVTFVGFATIPVYLYIYVSLFVFYFFKIQKDFRVKFILINILTGFFVFLFYLPILLNQGIDSIINNKYTKRINFDQILDYFFVKKNAFGFYDKIFGVNSRLIILILIITVFLILFFVKKIDLKNKIFIFRLLGIIFFPFVCIFIHKVLPGARTWSYLCIPFTILTAFILDTILSFFENLRNWILYLCLPIMIFVQIKIFTKTHPFYAHRNDFIAQKIVHVLRSNSHYDVYYEVGDRAYDLVINRFENLHSPIRNKKCVKLSPIIYVGNYNESQSYIKILFYDKISNKVVALINSNQKS